MERKQYVVTGGGGFVGKALALKLIEQGHAVRSIARREYPELKGHGIEGFQADLTGTLDKLLPAFKGAEAVFHVAAKVDMWGRYADFYSANVLATRQVIEACRRCRIKKLIFTSSPSVVTDGSNLSGINESYPYPKKGLAYYPTTKAIAEREVLGANDEELYTIALRPHMIFGPGDTHFVPTILERARAGKLVRIGKGKNRVDVTYIEDCVQAHIRALHALEVNPESRGKAYFISQGEPVNLWDWVNEVLAFNELSPVQRHIPKSAAYALAHCFELGCKLAPDRLKPLFTRFLISEMTTDHYFDLTRAKRDLNFTPQFSVTDALRKTFGAYTTGQACHG